MDNEVSKSPTDVTVYVIKQLQLDSSFMQAINNIVSSGNTVWSLHSTGQFSHQPCNKTNYIVSFEHSFSELKSLSKHNSRTSSYTHRQTQSNGVVKRTVTRATQLSLHQQLKRLVQRSTCHVNKQSVYQDLRPRHWPTSITEFTGRRRWLQTDCRCQYTLYDAASQLQSMPFRDSKWHI